MSQHLKIKTVGDPKGYYAEVPTTVLNDLNIRDSLTDTRVSADGQLAYLSLDPVKASGLEEGHVRTATGVSDFDLFRYAASDKGYELDIMHIDVGKDPDASREEFIKTVMRHMAGQVGMGPKFNEIKAAAETMFDAQYNPQEHAVRDLNPLLLPNEPVLATIDGLEIEGTVTEITGNIGDEVIQITSDAGNHYTLSQGQMQKGADVQLRLNDAVEASSAHTPSMN